MKNKTIIYWVSTPKCKDCKYRDKNKVVVEGVQIRAKGSIEGG